MGGTGGYVWLHIPLHIHSVKQSAILVIGGMVPMFVTAFVSAPYVNSIHLEIPGYARRSKEALYRFASNMPPDTRLELSALRWTRLIPRASKISELRLLPGKMGQLANLERVPEKIAQRKLPSRWRWLLRHWRGKYYVGNAKNGGRNSRAPGIWEMVMEQVARRSGRSSGGSAAAATRSSGPVRSMERPKPLQKAAVKVQTVSSQNRR
ncbi:hypothetical protein LTR66_007868 [Elasticomyces elasticus]|nr:hypothetical protein LTR66_007868 [Elasticomyces elasticus]